MIIRRLRPSDAPAYRGLMLEAYETHPDAFTSTAAERAALPLSWWEERLAATAEAKDAVWGAFSAETLIGVAGLSVERREKVSHKATLFGMYVRPGWRGRGVGDRLVRAVMLAARERGTLRVVQLTVTDGNAAARSLYEGHGFLPFGVEPFAVRVDDGFVAKVHMSCELSPDPLAAGSASAGRAARPQPRS